MKYRNESFKIAFTGMMLSLILLFQYLEHFFDLKMGYVKLNLSIIFILATGFIVGKRWVLLLIVLRFFIGPAISSLGYTDIGFWSQFALVVYDGLFLVLLYLLLKIFKNIYYATIISSIVVIIISPLLNGLFITPMFWYLMNQIKQPTVGEAIQAYEYAKPMFFMIPNYWGGMFGVYLVANIIKWAIVSSLFLVLWKVIKIHQPHHK